MSVVRKTDPNNLEPLFDDAQFREKVKRTVSQLQHKDRQVSLTSRPVYYTHLSELRRCPLHVVEPAQQVIKMRSYLQFMERFIE